MNWLDLAIPRGYPQTIRRVSITYVCRVVDAQTVDTRYIWPQANLDVMYENVPVSLLVPYSASEMSPEVRCVWHWHRFMVRLGGPG